MLKILFILFVSCVFSVLGQGNEIETLQVGETFSKTNISLMNVDGREISLNNAMNKNGLLIVFSCNSCPFVIGTSNFPGWELQYNSIFKEADKLDVGMVLVNSNEAKRDGADSYEKMQQRAQRMNYFMPYLLDENSSLANMFGAKTTPHVFLFDPEFKLVYSGSIDNMADNKRKKIKSFLLNAIIALSNNKKPKPYSTSPIGCSIKRLKTIK
jgi:thioredoxin-related protein